MRLLLPFRSLYCSNIRDHANFRDKFFWFGMVTKACTLLLIAYLVMLYWLNWRWGYTSDHVLSGLMAKSVLERGDRPIYVWTFGYQGILLEVYAIALLFKAFGISPIVLYAFSVLCFCLLLFTHKHYISTMYGKAPAWVGMFILACGSPYFYRYVMRPQPNYTESMLFGMILMILAQLTTKIFYIEQKALKPKHYLLFILSGFLVGFGLYTYIMIVFFILPIILYVISIYFRELISRASMSIFFRISITIAMFLCIVGTTYMTYCYFSGKIDPQTHIPRGSNEKYYLIISFAPIMIYSLIDFLRNIWKYISIFLVPVIFSILGAIFGYAPQLYFKYIQNGTSTAKTGINHDPFVFWNNIEKLKAGIRLFFNADSDLLGKSVLYFFLFIICLHLLYNLFSLIQFIIGKSDRDNILYIGPIFFLPFVVVALFGLSIAVVDVESSRYALPLYLYATTACSWFFYSNWKNSYILRQAIPIIVLLVIISGNWLHLTKTIHQQGSKPFLGEPAIQALQERGITHGFSWFWYAYAISFYTNEKIILQPIDSGYDPYYPPEVFAHRRIAFLHPDTMMLRGLSEHISVNDQPYLQVDSWYGDGIGFLVLEKQP